MLFDQRIAGPLVVISILTSGLVVRVSSYEVRIEEQDGKLSFRSKSESLNASNYNIKTRLFCKKTCPITYDL